MQMRGEEDPGPVRDGWVATASAVASLVMVSAHLPGMMGFLAFGAPQRNNKEKQQNERKKSLAGHAHLAPLSPILPPKKKEKRKRNGKRKRTTTLFGGCGHLWKVCLLLFLYSLHLFEAMASVSHSRYSSGWAPRVLRRVPSLGRRPFRCCCP